jgi:hypothetical protein
MNKKHRLISMIITISLLLALCACSNSIGRVEVLQTPSVPNNQNDISAEQSSTSDLVNDATESSNLEGEVIVTFEYSKQSGSASNQYAVWVEDKDGNYINTLYATKWTATGGYLTRPDSLITWVERSSINTMPDYYIDAISGATPSSSGSQSYTWNLKDINGETVSPGKYTVFVEGTLLWSNYILYTGVISIGDDSCSAQVEAEYIYEASDKQAALNSNSTENMMISGITVSYTSPADN